MALSLLDVASQLEALAAQLRAEDSADEASESEAPAEPVASA